MLFEQTIDMIFEQTNDMLFATADYYKCIRDNIINYNITDHNVL